MLITSVKIVGVMRPYICDMYIEYKVYIYQWAYQDLTSLLIVIGDYYVVWRALSEWLKRRALWVWLKCGKRDQRIYYYNVTDEEICHNEYVFDVLLWSRCLSYSGQGQS